MTTVGTEAVVQFDQVLLDWAKRNGRWKKKSFIPDDTRLTDLGIEDLDLIDFAVEMEGLGIEGIPPADFSEWRTVGEVRRYVQRRLAEVADA